MGIIVKVYLENIEEEIDIVTLNSDDKKSSSVTITANVIKDYLKKLGRNEDLPGHKDGKVCSIKQNVENNEINVSANNENEKRLFDSNSSSLSPAKDCNTTFNVNCDGAQCESHPCFDSGIHKSSFTPDNGSSTEKVDENTDSSEVISQNSNSNIQLNDVQEYIRVIEGTDVSDKCINQANPSATPNVNTAVEVVSSQLVHAGVLSEHIDLLVNNQPSENPEAKDADTVSDMAETNSQIAVTQNDETYCDNPSVNVNFENAEKNTSKNEANLSGQGVRMESEIGAENVIASLKNVSYEVDDFLNIVNTTPTNISHLRLSNTPSFLDEISNNSVMYHTEQIDEDEGGLEECFVIEKVAASRFNEETKVLEFLLQAEICSVRKEPWAPIRTNITDLTIPHPRCLYIQCPKGFKSNRGRKLYERYDQYVQFADEQGLTYDMSGTLVDGSSVIDTMTNGFSSVISSDVVVDPQKSLNDARLIEPFTDDNKNITPAKLLKNGETLYNMPDLSLPSINFCVNDIVPEFDQLVEFVENNPTPSTDAMCEAPVSKNAAKIWGKDRAANKKQPRGDNKHMQCPHCPYKTVSVNALSKHARRHTKEVLKCSLCPKQYLTVAGLKNHERTHQNGGGFSAEGPKSEFCDTFGRGERKPVLLVEPTKRILESESSPFWGGDPELPTAPAPVNGGALDLADRTLPPIECDAKCKMKANSKWRLKAGRGRPPKRPKIETIEPAADEVIDLCDDAESPATPAPSEAADKWPPSPTDGLQKCLADTVDAIESNDELGSMPDTWVGYQEEACQKREDTFCEACHKSFETTFALSRHRDRFHRYPIVLLKRLTISH